MPAGPRWWTLLPLAAGLAAAALLPAREPARASPADPQGNRWQQRRPAATLVLMGRNQGKLKPCGCTAPQKGGLERAAVAVELLVRRADGALAVAALGGIMPPPRASAREIAQNALKAQLYRAVLQALGAQAFVLGANDLFVRDLVVAFGGAGGSEIDRPRFPLNVK